MLSNYLKIAWRNIVRQKGYSFINIFGLAVGMACCLLILLFVKDELSFDRFHANAKTLFLVEQDAETSGGKFHVSQTPCPLGPALQSEIPEISATARVANPCALLVRYGENAYYERRVFAVDPQFCRMFTFPLLKGDAATILCRPGSLVLTAEMARKYFGGADPLGKVVTINNTNTFTVTGVLNNIPRNSSLSFDMLVPFDFVKVLGQYNDSMNWNNIQTFVQLHAKSAAAVVGEKITQLVRKRTNADNHSPTFMLTPLVDIKLFGYDLAIKNIYTFSALALFVLLIACINFMNLATARSANRAMEVGLRKVSGAQRKSIICQFYGESVLTTLLAAAASIVLVLLFIPAFNTLSGKMLKATDLLSGKYLLGILAVTFFTGIVAGSYPALFLSSFQPVSVLKSGRYGGAKSARFRKTLVVFQFSLSILLLIGMGVVSRQIDYMRNKKLGYDKEQLIYLPLNGESYSSYSTLKEQLLQNHRILGVTATEQPPTSISSKSGGADWDGKDPTKEFLIAYTCVDFDYPETLKIDMAAGRAFSRQFATDNGKAWLVNEDVTKLMGLNPASAVGQRFNFGVEGPIVGVMKNFHYQSVRNAIAPLAVLVSLGNVRFATVRLKAGEIPAALEDVKQTWRRVNPQYPFEFHFFEEDFDKMYRADERLGSLLKVFAGMAIIIACLGLFGLASFMAEQRTREIGVRKVLGATSFMIVRLLSQEFVGWVLIANVLAWPVAYFLMHNWLLDFAYRISLGIGTFMQSGMLALLIALLTVSLQAIRAARANPVESLRYE